MLVASRVHPAPEEPVLSMLLATMTSAWAAPLEIQISDPQIVSVVLECTDGTYRSVVKDGLARFERKPENCTVNIIRRAGVIDEPGEWRCDAQSCSMKDVFHRPVENADGRVNIILSKEAAPGSWMELQCASGYRNRAEIDQNTSTFDGVPRGEICTLFLKGGAPLRYKPIEWGTHQCTVDVSTMNCVER
jgi:hypothetical protein